MNTLQSPTHYLILLAFPVALANLVSIIGIPVLAARIHGVWWKWLLLTLAIGAFAWIPFVVFLNQNKKTVGDSN